MGTQNRATRRGQAGTLARVSKQGVEDTVAAERGWGTGECFCRAPTLEEPKDPAKKSISVRASRF